MANVDGPVKEPGADDQNSPKSSGEAAPESRTESTGAPESERSRGLVPVPLMGAALGLHPSSTVLSEPAPANDVQDQDAERPAPPRSGTSVKQSATQRLASLIRSLFAR